MQSSPPVFNTIDWYDSFYSGIYGSKTPRAKVIGFKETFGGAEAIEWTKSVLKNIKIKKKPKHISKSKGDGLGYDILSYNESGKKIYIEVKTTRKGKTQPFYISKNELSCSEIEGNQYFIYRLYEFDDKKISAKYFIRQGSLFDLCNNPMLYRVVLE